MLVASYLPQQAITNDDFAELGVGAAERIYQRTGIRQRRVTATDEFALDLAEKACLNLFAKGVDSQTIDFIVYCTQSPDSILPNNASLLQHRLQLSTRIGSFDINQGCTGFVYGLSIAKGIIQSGQAKRVLLVTSDTYSKYLRADDYSSRSIFADGASATVINKQDADNMLDFAFYTDGGGARLLNVSGAGLRDRQQVASLYMNGPGIFMLTLKLIPSMCDALIQGRQLNYDDISHFFFHQANAYMLEHLRKKLGINKSRFHYHLQNVGNTVSSTIPLTIEHHAAKLTQAKEQYSLLVSFGIGYSIAVCLLKIHYGQELL